MANRKLFVGNYTFDADLQYLTIKNHHIKQEEFLMITNVSNGTIIYNFADASKGFTTFDNYFDEYGNPTTICTLAYNTSSMNDNDKLQIFIEKQHTEFSPTEDLLDPVGKLRVSNPENLIDTDFEYGLQSTKWESLQTVNNIPTIYSSTGDIPLEGVQDARVSSGNKTVTITTNVNHGLSIGDPISVSGMDLYSANGYFVITSTADEFTLSYDMDVISPSTASIFGSYTTIVPSKFFEGSSLPVSTADGAITDGQNPSTITVTTQEAHGFQDSTKVYIRNSAGPRTFVVDDSAATAPDGAPYIDLTQSFGTTKFFDTAVSTGRGGSQDKEVYTYDWESTYTKYLTATDIDIANDTITWNNHGLQTNYCLLFNTPRRGDNDIGLTDGYVYYVQVVDINTIKLATQFDSTGGGGQATVNLTSFIGTYGSPRLGLVYQVESADGVKRETTYAAGSGGASSATIARTASSYMSYSGAGTSGSPFTAYSTNNGRHGSFGYIDFTVSGAGGTVDYSVSVSSETSFDYARLYLNGSQQFAISGATSRTGTLTVSAGDVVRFAYSKDGSVNSRNDRGYLNSLVFTPTPSAGGGGLTVEMSGSDLVDSEFGLGVVAPTSLLAFQGRTPGSYSSSQDSVSYLQYQRTNGRYGTQSVPYPSLSVSSGDLAGSFNISTSNTQRSFNNSQIFYVFARQLSSLRNTLYSATHGLEEGQLVTVTVDPTVYSAGERFAFNDITGPTTINSATLDCTVSIVSPDVFRLTINNSPNTDDISTYPSKFSIEYERANETFNTLYLGNHRIPENVEATYTTGAGGTAPTGFTSGGTYLLSRVNDDRVSFDVAGAVQNTNFGPQYTPNGRYGSSSNASVQYFINVESDFSLAQAPTQCTIEDISFRGDMSAGSEYITVSFSDGTSYTLGQYDDIGDTSTWKESTTWQAKNVTSLLTTVNGSTGFYITIDPSSAVNYSPSGMPNGWWWELKFNLSGSSGIVFTDPGSGQQIFEVESTVGSYDGVYEIQSSPTTNSFTLTGDFQIPALSFDFTSTGVDTATNVINLGKIHNLITGEKINYNPNGNTTILPADLTDYYAIVTGRETLAIAGSYVDAVANNRVTLNAPTGTHTISSENIIKGVKGTGTASAVANSTQITGIGTRFLSNFKRFDKFWIDNGTYVQEFVVDGVTSDTTLTVFTAPTTTVNNVDYYYATQLILRPDGYNLHLPFDGGVEITAGTSPYSKIVRQTRKYFRYQSGKGIQNSFAINFNPPKIVKELIKASGTTATVDTQEAHNLQVGDQIVIDGATVDFGENTYNGTFNVDTVVNPFKFTYEMSQAPSDVRAGGFPTYVRTGWTDSYVRAGMFDDQNGFFYEFDGQQLSAVRRSSTLQLSGTISVERGNQVVTGSGTSFTSQLTQGAKVVIRGQSYQVVDVASDNRLVIQPAYRGVDATLVKITKTVDVKVPQPDWSIDPADGTGPTGFNLDTTKLHMAYADYSWYGAGKIRFGFKDLHGHIRYLHEFTHNNRLSESYFRSGNLPARYEIENGAQPTTAPTLFHFGTSVIMDGTFDDDKAYQFTGQSRQFAMTDSNISTIVTEEDSTFALVTLNGKRVYVYKFEITTANAANLSVGMRTVDTGGDIPEDTYISQIKDLGTGNSEIYVAYPATATNPAGSPLYPTMAAGASVQFGDRANLDDYIPLVSVRLAPSVDSSVTGTLGERDIINRMQLALRNASVTANADSEVYLILNALPSRLDYENAQNPSLSEIIEHQIEDTLLNATVIYSTKVSAGQSIEIALAELLEVGNSILGGDGVFPAGPDLLTLAVQPQVTTGISFNSPYKVSGKVSWAESQA